MSFMEELVTRNQEEDFFSSSDAPDTEECKDRIEFSDNDEDARQAKAKAERVRQVLEEEIKRKDTILRKLPK